MSISMKRNRPGDRFARHQAHHRSVYAVWKSGGCAALDGVGADFVNRDLLKKGPIVRIVGEPAFGGIAILCEMQEFRAVAEVLQNADHADFRTLDHLETQITFDGPGTPDRDDDEAALARKSPSCRVKQAGEV